MLVLEGFVVENYYLWQKPAPFKVEPGLTLITGENRSGKSSLFRPLDLSILGAAAGKRGDSNSKMPKGARVQTRFATEDRQWLAELSSSQLRLFENDTDLGSTGKRAAQTHLHTALQMPPALWNATVHLTALGDHPLLHGTPQTRLDWLSAVLGLEDIYDRAHAALGEQIERATAAASRHALFTEELAHLPQPGAAPDVATAERRYAEIQASRARYAAVRDALAALDATPAVAGAQQLPAALARHAARVADLEAEIIVAETYEALAATRATRQRLQEQLRSLPTTRRPQAVAAELDEATARDRELREAWDRWNNAAPPRDRAARLQTVLRAAPTNPTAELEKIEVELRVLRQQIHSLSHETGTTCSICARPLPPAARTRLARTALAEIDKRAGRHGRLQDWAAAARELQELREQLATVEQPRSAPPNPAALDRLRDELAAAETRTRLQQRLADLGPTHAACRRPCAPLNELRTALDTARTNHERIQHTAFQADARAAAERRLAELQPGSRDLAALRHKGHSLDERYRIHLSQLEQARAAAAAHTALVAQRTRLQEKIAAEHRIAQYLPALQALRAATGKRGLRLARIEELANTFQAEFNRLVGLFWPGDFRLDLVIKSNGLHLLATRAGAREDLSGLSGAEGKVWRMLCALTLIRILPAPFRCDTVILDELDANLDAATEVRLAREFIPALLANVPKVIFITPRDIHATGLAPNRVYRAVKQGASSTLQRVH